MSKFGKKFVCWSCATKFYDLNKPAVKCPKCGANPEDDPTKEDYGDEIDEELEAPAPAAADDEDAEEEPGDDAGAPADDDY